MFGQPGSVMVVLALVCGEDLRAVMGGEGAEFLELEAVEVGGVVNKVQNSLPLGS